MINKKKLNKKIIQYHNSGDTLELMNSYVQASGLTKSIDEKAFLLTQSYVFSLELGDEELSNSIFKKLREIKRI